MPPGEDLLTAALAAGIPIPHSCRAGRCASCKSRLVSGSIEYPGGTPPGITADEMARGEVLLCQARPRGNLVIEARRIPVRAANAATGELVAVEPLPFDALRLRLRFLNHTLEVRPGQFVDARNHAGDADRLPVVAVSPGIVELESAAGGTLHSWLSRHAPAGTPLRISGPFDRLR